MNQNTLVGKIFHLRSNASSAVLQCVAVCCRVLQCVAVCGSVLQRRVTFRQTNLFHLRSNASSSGEKGSGYSLPHTTTHCNTLQHTATRCNITQWEAGKGQAT